MWQPSWRFRLLLLWPLVLATRTSAAQDAACTFDGARGPFSVATFQVEVGSGGEAVASARVPAENVRLTLTAEAGVARAEVRGPIEFDGRVRGVSAWSPGPIDVAGAMLHLSRRLVGGLRVTAGVVSGEVAWRDQHFVVALPCDQLRRGVDARGPRVEPSFRSDDLRVVAPRNPWRVQGDRLVFRSLPGAGDTLVVTPSGDEFREMQHIEHRDGYVHLALSWRDGTRLHGWLPRANAAPRPPPCRACGYGSGAGRGLRTRGSSGPTVRAERGPWPRVTQYTYEGPATVRAGVEIRAGRAGRAWARTTRDLPATVFLDGVDETWVPVRQVGGWGVDGYVLQSELVLPPGANEVTVPYRGAAPIRRPTPAAPRAPARPGFRRPRP